jgi:ABC-2 type transport system permease protein
MTTATLTPDRAAAGGAVRVTFPRVLHAEWIRLRSLRSTWITMLVTIAIVVGFGALSCYGYVSRDHANFVGIDPAFRSLVGTFFGQLAFGVLGVLVVTGEYSTGMIRATFTAVPRRLAVFTARLSVFAVTTLAVLVPTTIVTFLVGQTILARDHVDTTLGAPDVLRAVVGAALYLVAIGLLGMAFGWLVRHTAGAIATLVGVLLVLPLLVVFLPDPWPTRLAKWLPSGAGQSILHVHTDTDRFAPWTGFGVLMAYVVIVLVAAAVLLRSRDV